MNKTPAIRDIAFYRDPAWTPLEGAAVKVYGLPYEGRLDNDFRHTGLFLSWATFNRGGHRRNVASALVMKADGTVDNVPADQIRFVLAHTEDD